MVIFFDVVVLSFRIKTTFLAYKTTFFSINQECKVESLRHISEVEPRAEVRIWDMDKKAHSAEETNGQ